MKGEIIAIVSDCRVIADISTSAKVWVGWSNLKKQQES